MKKIFESIIFYVNPALFLKLQFRKFEKNKLPMDFLNHLQKLKPSDLVIDLGANLGFVTECLAKTRAEVVAFEPNSKALKGLDLVASRYDNVKVVRAAAGIKNSVTKLYLHQNPLRHTQASSLKADKPNVLQENYEEVYEIDFAEYIVKLGRPIELIKIDIEGYEIELLNHLLDKKSLSNVGRVYVETHERKFEALRDATVNLKRRIKEEGLEEKFNYNWH